MNWNCSLLLVFPLSLIRHFSTLSCSPFSHQLFYPRHTVILLATILMRSVFDYALKAITWCFSCWIVKLIKCGTKKKKRKVISRAHYYHLTINIRNVMLNNFSGIIEKMGIILSCWACQSVCECLCASSHVGICNCCALFFLFQSNLFKHTRIKIKIKSKK